MAEVAHRRKRRTTVNTTLEAVLGYAALGWPVCRGAHPSDSGGRACGCDRLGCPAPAAHPMSATWGLEAATDPQTIRRWWASTPQANVILPTGRVFDVFDVPARAGEDALARMDAAGMATGPVASVEARRHLFFVATRSPVDEEEWWTCHLDCFPESVDETPGLRWHCRDSYVLAPPSRLPSGNHATWIRPPAPSGHVTLPDPIAALDILAGSCEEFTQPTSRP